MVFCLAKALNCSKMSSETGHCNLLLACSHCAKNCAEDYVKATELLFHYTQFQFCVIVINPSSCVASDRTMLTTTFCHMYFIHAS